MIQFVAKSKTKMFQMAANPDENLISNERKKSCKSLMDGEKVAEEEQVMTFFTT